MKSKMENKDWLNDYKALKQVNPLNPFTVPHGYFDDLGDRIAALKNLEELKVNSPSDGFAAPGNYFDELTANIQSRIALEEVYGENAGFTVPDGYFENLGQQIQSRIAVEEALGDASGNFTVPEGYFSRLNSNILDKTVNTATANHSGIVRRMFTSVAFKYATAASFVLVIGGGILLNELTDPVYIHNNSFLHKQMSGVPVDEIKNYLQLNEDAGDTQQTVVTAGAHVDDKNLKDALQNYVDSMQ
ncbi:MAG TPA: hypothetical protein DCO83_12150 [Mucilaginibacter sp.]|nr:hypothetical protein [Mucilaginibacter sp.]